MRSDGGSRSLSRSRGRRGSCYRSCRVGRVVLALRSRWCKRRAQRGLTDGVGGRVALRGLSVGNNSGIRHVCGRGLEDTESGGGRRDREWACAGRRIPSDRVPQEKFEMGNVVVSSPPRAQTEDELLLPNQAMSGEVKNTSPHLRGNMTVCAGARGLLGIGGTLDCWWFCR